MRWLDNLKQMLAGEAYLGYLLLYAFTIPTIVVTVVAIMANCSMPHEILGWKRPENLATICHVWDEDTQKTMLFNNSMAKKHIKYHDEDYWGECQ